MGIFTERLDVVNLTDLEDFPEAHEEGQYLRATSSGVEYVVIEAANEFPRHYIDSGILVNVNAFGQYVIEETGKIEVAGAIEFGDGGMLIIRGV